MSPARLPSIDQMHLISGADVFERSIPDVNFVKVLVIDAEDAARRSIKVALERHGYTVIQAVDGPSGRAALSRAPDLILLDLEMPDTDGFALLRLLKQHQRAPIVIVSAVGDEDFKVHALDNGASDYITKPFSVGELLARIPKALRHGLQINGERSAFIIDDIAVDLVRRSVLVRGSPVKLTPKEFDLLRLFIRHAGEAISYPYILERLWSPRTGRKYLHATVRRLRTKLETPAKRDLLIESIAGVGYRLRANDLMV